jgi:hypothetical protein
MESDIYKKEYSLTEILSVSWKIFRGNVSAIFAIILLVGIPLNAVTIISNGAFSVSIPELNNPDLSPDELNALIELHMYEITVSFMTIAMVTLITSLISLISAMALAFFVKSCIDDKKISLQSAYAKALGRWPSAILTFMIFLLLLVVSFLLVSITPLFLFIIIPGIIIYSVRWWFAITAVALSGKYGKAAVDHSGRIVKKRWWNVFKIALILFLFNGFSLFCPAGVGSGLIFLTLLNLFSSYLLVVQIIMYLNYESTIRADAKKY